MRGTRDLACHNRRPRRLLPIASFQKRGPRRRVRSPHSSRRRCDERFRLADERVRDDSIVPIRSRLPFSIFGNRVPAISIPRVSVAAACGARCVRFHSPSAPKREWFADDFIILCRNESEARAALVHVWQWVEEAGLTLHPEKYRCPLPLCSHSKWSRPMSVRRWLSGNVIFLPSLWAVAVASARLAALATIARTRPPLVSNWPSALRRVPQW